MKKYIPCLLFKKFFVMSDFIGDSLEDWTVEHQAVLAQSIREAYSTSAHGVRSFHSALRLNPNRIYAQGYMRWVTLDSLLYEACMQGRLRGITGTFRKNKSGPDSLELAGKKTRTLLVHLSDPDECPARSDLREQARECNQTLLSFMQEPGAHEKPVQLLLVHAGEKYAGLRIYYDREMPSLYHDVTGNILDRKPSPVSVFETERVAESHPALTLVAPEAKAALPVAN